ncbi:GldG family protein [Candidatus Poribacteria bacterium]|nr:GldG family protein [Candidatus Poribacteria bacterium]
MARPSSSPLRSLAVPALGIAMVLGTLAWGAAMGAFPAWLLGMGACGLAVALLGVLWQEAGNLRLSVYSLSYSFFVLHAAVFLYLLVANHSERMDLTRGHIHTLSPQTVQFLRHLDKEVHVAAFAEPKDFASLQNFFKLYERESALVTFDIHDPLVDVEEARRFGDSVFPGDLFATAYSNGTQLRRQRFVLRASDEMRESRLSNALMKVSAGSDDKIYFTRGKGERPLEQPPNLRDEEGDISLSHVAKLLTDRVLPIETLDLQSAGKIPDDAAAVVLASPTSDLFDSERETLLNYWNEGGSLLILLDPDFRGTATPNIEAVLARVGLVAPNRLVVDPFGRPRNESILAAQITDHPIIQASGTITVVMPVARPLEAHPDFDPKGGEGVVQPLLLSRAECWQEPAEDYLRQPRHERPTDAKQVHAAVLATASQFPTPGGVRGEAARAVVFGDSDFIGNSTLNNDSAVLLLQSVNWLGAREEQLAIPPRLVVPSRFTLTQSGYWLMVGSLMVIGLAILGGGAGYTIARRRMG